MSARACPGTVVASNQIETVMRMIEANLNPKENLKDEVSALHDVYLQRKSILQDIDAKYNELRHQQRLLAREGASHRVRAPRPAKPTGCTPTVPMVLDGSTLDAKSAIVPTED